MKLAKRPKVYPLRRFVAVCWPCCDLTIHEVSKEIICPFTNKTELEIQTEYGPIWKYAEHTGHSFD
jgi:hypothetical protein